MLGLAVFVLLILLFVAVSATGMTSAARAVGSRHGTFRIGLLVTLFGMGWSAWPGERLRMEGGHLHVDDVRQDSPAVLSGKFTVGYLQRSSYRDGDTIPLGPDEYFLIGDEPTISADSRTDGPTREKDLVGVVDLVYWPASRFEVLR